MGSVFDKIVKEDCLEEAALSRGLNGVREPLSWLLRRRARKAEGTPSAKSLREKKKCQLCLSAGRASSVGVPAPPPLPFLLAPVC